MILMMLQDRNTLQSTPKWAIEYNDEYISFTCIEDAIKNMGSHIAITAKVHDQIDHALIEMYSTGNNKATFTSDGTFISSERL